MTNPTQNQDQTSGNGEPRYESLAIYIMSTPLSTSSFSPSPSPSTSASNRLSLHLPPYLLSEIISHLSPIPPSFLLVSKLFMELSLSSLYRNVSLSQPHQYPSFLSDSKSKKEGWKRTTSHLKLTIAQSDSIALVWLPRLLYLAAECSNSLVDGVGAGFGTKLKTIELAFGKEGWVGGTVSAVQQLFLSKKGFPFVEHVVLKEYVAPTSRFNKSTKKEIVKKKQPRASKKKSKGAAAGTTDVDIDQAQLPPPPSSETAASETETISGLPASSPVYLKFLSKLLSSPSNLQSISLPLALLVHPSSPWSTALPSFGLETLIVLPLLEGTEDDEVQTLVDGLENWLKRMFEGPSSKGRKLVEKGKGGLRRLDLRALESVIEEEGMEELGRVVEVEGLKVLV
ncbi:hypothetical protein BDY24DRAFT_413255 [Mrakia frigida]|uniref:uncharacterized protein n=1 Tax=Mrakia frigida TaxID=29902 RepID=UPI003FCC20AC